MKNKLKKYFLKKWLNEISKRALRDHFGDSEEYVCDHLTVDRQFLNDIEDSKYGIDDIRVEDGKVFITLTRVNYE